MELIPVKTHTRRTRRSRLAAVIVSAALLAGCHRDMWDGGRYKPLESAAFYADGASARTLVAGTIPYQGARLDEHYYAGKVDGEYARTLPAQVELSRELLERGQARFNIYCLPCHGAGGDGRGMIPQRGFPEPPSYHIDRLREVPIGYFFDVMTNGFGRMYSYATRVPVQDRWAIAAYIRALQLSRHATPDLLPAAVLEEARTQPAAPAEGEHQTYEQH